MYIKHEPKRQRGGKILGLILTFPLLGNSVALLGFVIDGANGI